MNETPGGTPDRWVSGDAYENFMGRWSRRMAKEFIRWLAPPPGWRWLEVGCGTGALAAAICVDAAPGGVVACDPSAHFVSFARSGFSHPALTFQVAGVGDLPHTAGGFDAAVAGLVLNFTPDPAQAVAEMVRRLHPGGLLAGYVWDYSEGMQFIKIFWEAAADLDPAAAELDEGPRFPLCHREALTALLEGAGLEQVEARGLEIDTLFPNFDDYWAPFLGGTGPGPAYVMSLPPDARERLRLRLKQRLAHGEEGPVALRARAWAAKGYLGGQGVPWRLKGTWAAKGYLGG